MKSKTFCRHLLAQIPRDALDNELLAHLDMAERKARAQSILLRGLVTGKLWVIFHVGSQPSKRLIHHAERHELAALSVLGEFH